MNKISTDWVHFLTIFVCFYQLEQCKIDFNRFKFVYSSGNLLLQSSDFRIIYILFGSTHLELKNKFRIFEFALIWIFLNLRPHCSYPDLNDQRTRWYFWKCTEVRFASFLSGGFITTVLANPQERNLATQKSVWRATLEVWSNRELRKTLTQPR